MNKKEKTHNQYEKWIKNNHDFGQVLDNTKFFTDSRFDAKPRIKTCFGEQEEMTKYFDKTKFLNKFSVFDGYMQYVDQTWELDPAHGIDIESYKVELNNQSND